MRSNDSYYKSNQRESNQATATKSPNRRVDQTQAYTPTRFSRKPSDRINELKNTLSQCIESMSNKKQANRQALQQVKQVNQEIIENLSNQNSERGYKSSRRHNEEYRIPQYQSDYARGIDARQQKQRDNVTLSSFHLAPADNAYRQSNFHVSEIYRPESVRSTHTEIEDIRQRIRTQRMQNEQLQRQIQALRRQQQQLSSFNTNYGQTSYLLNENARLRNELVRLEGQQNIQAVYEQFQKLKEDNERLRKETISMLKNVRY